MPPGNDQAEFLPRLTFLKTRIFKSSVQFPTNASFARHGLLPAPGNNLGREKSIRFGCLKRLRSHRTKVVAEEVNALGGGKVVVVDDTRSIMPEPPLSTP